MSDETSRLSLAVDSSQVKAANQELDRFSATGNRAAASANEFATAAWQAERELSPNSRD